MATTLSVGDIAIVHYNSTTDTFSFVFLRDVQAGAIVNFTDNGWLSAGGFRAGENTVTYTAPAAIAAGAIITLSGLDLDAAGDQIIAYQGDPATPTILHVADFADGNNTVAGNATNDNTTALPPGFTLGVNAVAVAFDTSLYAGPTSGSPEGLFAALNNSANWLGHDALPATLIVNAKPIIDLDADDSTHLGDDYEGTVVAGGPAVPISDTDVAIDDPDGLDIFGAEIRVIGLDAGDLLAVNGSLPPGIVASPFRTPDGILRLEGQASHADYEQAIRQVVFSTTDALDDLKRINVSLFDGNAWSKSSTAFIAVTFGPTVAPPGLDLDANDSTGGGADATATYTAGGPAMPVTDIDVSITADVSTIESATITILGFSLNPGDMLSVAGTLPAGITASSYNPFTGIITLSGPALLADYQIALRQVVYSNTLDAPSQADRAIQVTVNDGNFESNLATMYMHVAIPPPNLAPVLNLDADSSTTPGTNYLTVFTEGALPVAIVDIDVLAFDSDSPSLASATITLTNPQAGDHLTFDGTPPAGILVSGSGTNVIRLTGVVLSGSYQTALQQIKFSNTSIDPSNVTRSIEVVVSDGTSDSNTATAIVQVEAVNNSAPVIDLDPNDSSASVRTTFRTIFTENGAPIPIADTDISITDLDSITLVFATITLANHQAGDLLIVTQTLPGGIIASAYNPGTGVLTLTGTATLDDYEVALQRVLYGSTSEDPGTDDRLIEVLVNDGVNTSNVAAALINVLAVNDKPDILLDTSAAYVENAAVTPLAPLATLTDVDDAEFSEAVVRITDGTIPGDGDILSVDGLTSGTTNGITFLWDAAEHALVFTGASLAENYQDLLRIVGFNSTSNNPTDFGARATRVLTWSVSDGTAVTTITTTIDILAVNDAPQAAVAATASYTENAAPVVLSPASIATDVDNITLVSGEVRIVSGAVAGDLLTVNGLQSGTFAGIDFFYDPVLRSLKFTHPTAVADYQAFLEAVAFSSTSDDPTSSGVDPTRTLFWFISDGDAFSDVRTTVLSITALADAPLNTVPGAQSVNEDTLLPIAGVSVADVDSTALTTTLTVTSGRLSVTAGAGVTGNGTGSVTITGTATEINAALAGLAYTGNLNFNGADTLTVTTSDGALNDTDTLPITVNAVNDLPVNTVPGPLSVNEDTTLPIGVSVADLDSAALTTTLSVMNGRLTVATGGGATIGGNGTATVTISGTTTQINSALAGLGYRGSLNFNGADTLTVITSDGSLSDTDTVPITVNAVNDPPANTVPGAQSVAEDTTLPIAGVSVADVDSTALTATLTVASGTLNVATGGGATIGGNGSGTVTISGTAGQINTALAGLSYRGNLNFNGADTLTVTTSDGALNDTDTVPITVNAVNDPPVNTVPGPLSVNEDTTLPIGVSVADLDSSALTTTLSVTNGTLTVATGGGATIGGNGSGTVTISGTASQINGALAGLGYRGSPNFNGSDTLTVTTSDGSLSDTDAVPITVNAVNDPPANAVPGPQTVAEDTTLAIAGVSVADVDSTALTATLSVVNGALTVTTGGGATIGGNGSGTVTISGTAGQINNALAGLSYRGNLNFNGADTLTVTTSDGSLNDIDTVPITVNAVNDPPVNTVPGPLSVNEDTTLPIGVSVADLDSAALTTTLTVTNGTLTVATGGGATIGGNGSGTVTISGTASQINGALAGLGYRGNLNFNGSDTLTVATSDGSLSDTDTVPITVNAVDDPPVNTVPGPQTVAEDTTLPIAGVSVADVDSTALTTTLSVTNGKLNVTTGGGAVIAGDGTATVTISGTATEINNALAGLSYLGNLDFNGSDTLTVATSDGSLSDIDVVGIAVGAAGDPPVNTVPGPQTVDEDTVLPIAGVSVADADSTVLTTTLSVANGTLDVTGAGVSGSGTATVTITGSATQINAALGTLGYLGNPDFNGSDTLTVSTFDGSLTDTDTVVITVNPVSDPPVNIVPGAQSVNEDTTLLITGVSVADVDSTALSATLTVAHGTLAATGTGVSGSGTATLTIAGTAAQINTALAGLSYLGNPDFNGPDTLTVTTSDGALTDTDTVPITVQAANDLPVNTVPGPQTVDEDTVLPIAGLSVADVDSLTLVTTLTVAHGVLTATGAGVSGNGTATMSIAGTAAQVNAALATLGYLGNPDFNGADTLTVTTSDGSLSDTDTVPITVNAVNDPPANTVPGAQSVNEDTTLPIAGVSIADVDSAALTATLTVAHGTLTATGTGVSGSGTATLTIAGTAAQVNAALATLGYLGNPNFNGSDALTVVTSDGALTDTDTVAITVNAVNDAPVNTVPPAQSVNEDTVLPIAGLSVADLDSPVLLTTLSVAHGTLTAAGAGVSASGTNMVVIVGTAAEINAALGTLTYLGDAHFNGADTLTVTTLDGALNDTDAVPITVNAVNDPPVNTVPGAQSVAEDTTLPITGMSVADLDSAALTTTLSVTNGTLTVATGGGATIGGNGTGSVTIGGTAIQINSALAGLSYLGKLDFNGADTLTVTTSDGLLGDTDTVAITVNAVNDLPVNTVPGPQIANEDTALLIAGLSVVDTDSPLLVTTLAVAHGTLTATGTGVSGSGTTTLTIAGTGTELNAALSTLSYRGNLNFNGADTLTVTTSDGALSDTDTVPITVNAVNDPPVNTVPGAQSVSEETTLSIGGVSVADVDSPTLTTTLTVTSGTLSVTAGGGATIGGNGSVTVTLSGTGTQISAALVGLTYQGILNFNGPDTLTVTTSDGVIIDTDAVPITVNAVNDAPVNTVPGAQSVAEDTTLAIAGVSVADVDNGLFTTILSVTSGSLTVGAGGVVSNNGTGTVTIIGSAAQINAALATLSYRGNLNFNGADTLTVTTSDGPLIDADTVAITVNAVNDRPVLDLDADNSSGAAGVDYTATFVEGGAAVAIADLDDLITDVDNANLASATITLANHQPSDLLSVIGTLPAGITASAYDPATGVLMLSGAATLAAYQAALRQIAFGNGSPIPSATDRVISIAVNDGVVSSPAAHAFVHVVPVATAPSLDLDANNSSGAVGADYTAIFIGGGAAVPIADADTLIADADSSNIVAATIALTNAEANDFLAANGDLPTGIAGAFNPATGIFTLTGSAPLADYQAALRQIEFGSTDPNLLTATRIIEIVVNDGSADSNAALSLIQIAVSAPPTLDLDADDSTATGSDYATIFTEGGAPVQIADTDIVFSAPPVVSATITLTNPFPGDLLTVIGELPDGITFDYDPVNFVLTLNGPGTAATFQSVANQVVYTNSDPNPSTDHRIITVVANDGNSDSNIATAFVNFAGANDPPSLSVAPAASYTENAAAVVVSPDVTISDPDNPTMTVGIAAITAGLTPGDVLSVGGLRSGRSGSLAFDWAPTLNELIVTGAGTPEEYEALFQSVRFQSDSDDPTNGGADTTRTVSWAVFDGATTTIATTTLTLTAVNDAPVNVIPAILEAEANTDTAIAGLSVSDGDAGAGTLTTTLSVTNGTLTIASAGGAAVAGSGTDTVALTGTLAQINTTLAMGNVIYRGAQDFFGTDMLTVTTNDGGNSGAGGALTDTDQVTINLNTHLIGTPNDDNFTALPGNERIDALGSIDTITFGFRLVDATVTYDGNTVIIDGPGSHTVLTGFETYVFTDGTVNNNDGNWLLDDLFYYSQYHDVWNAGVDADEHYDTFGWHESRDPSAFFSSMIYLSAYPDVAAAGVNPLDHWHEIGWTEGRVPSLDFGPREYFSAYPDVEAAHVDPLEHFLLFGAGELREPFPPGELVTGNGFDYVYYLQHNPDVAAAGVDPFAHFQAVGWREGRDPNALFDVSGYLATYADVAAANVNPLDHYDQFGWHEGRDPSVDFDTTSYLAAYPDVAAAGSNPLTHYLQFGDDESRSPFNDGVWN